MCDGETDFQLLVCVAAKQAAVAAAIEKEKANKKTKTK